jgi:hypothetical protein
VSCSWERARVPRGPQGGQGSDCPARSPPLTHKTWRFKNAPVISEAESLMSVPRM